MSDLIKLEPQPRNGKPFRIPFVNRGYEYWYNERTEWRHGYGPVLMWECPFGLDGEPVKIDGIWYWRETT